ncbi:putative odorant-binding protein A10 isoform X2 [Teleopsis dalmanni]|uniref:putative odorant-binding protein A10 isoform X2 n=1 Tax=Teleopsis dalmanni TaxID=139649 RepID=UPI0018CD3FE1|nr:putative odorant-binding protein A10 isoform X2 [Teleopsis dalmanni]
MLRLLNTVALILIVYGVGLTTSLPHPPTTTAPLIAARQTYDTKFDNVNLDELLGQERLLKNYIKCLESTGPCTPDGKMLKETLPEAMSTNCAKCSVKQKYGSDKVTHFLIDNRPEDWKRLEKIYDPQGAYRKQYLAQKEKNNSMSVEEAQESTTFFET